MRTTRTTAVAFAAAAALVAVSACGSASSGGGAGTTAKLAPLAAAKAGFAGLQEGSAATETITFDADPATLVALDKVNGDKTPEAVYKLVTGGSVRFALSTGGTPFKDLAAQGLGALAGVKAAVDVNAGDEKDLVQIAYANKILYARADVKKIASYGQYATPPRDLSGQVDAFLASPTAKQFPFLADGAAGKWLKVDLGQVFGFVKSFAPTAVPSVSPQQIMQLQQALAAVVDKDVTATRADADGTYGDHLVLKGNARTVSADLVTALKTYVTSISPEAAKGFADVDPSKVPDKDVTVDEYVKGGVVDRIVLPLKQFLSPEEATAVGDKALAVVVDISPKADISVPSNATNIDVPGLIGKLGAVARQSASSSAGLSSGGY